VCAPRTKALAFASKAGYEWQGRLGKSMAFTHQTMAAGDESNCKHGLDHQLQRSKVS
jgi:hypothetical protein